MLIARGKGLFSRTYEVLDGDSVVASLNVSSWKEKATVEAEGKSYRFEREGAVSGSFLLLDVEKVVAYAKKPSALKDRFEITYFSALYALRKPSIWKSGLELEEHGRVVGAITPVGYFQRKIEIDLPTEMPLVVKVFIFWLALIIWNRQQAAVVASS